MALAGGVGGAKLIQGLADISPPEELTCIINIGDDDKFHGLYVCPDLDTVMYTLAGMSDPSKGWGIKNETYNALRALGILGQDNWFNLGDQDIATHLVRTKMLSEKFTLTQVSNHLSAKLGVQSQVIPISDGSLSTVLHVNGQSLTMQEYFVKYRTSPVVTGIEYVNQKAKISGNAETAIKECESIIICPSNPLLSIAPILAVKEVRELLRANSDKTVCVSPLIGEDSVSGPAGKLMKELGMEVSVIGLAEFYKDICKMIIIDESDSQHEPTLVELGFSVKMLPIMMENSEQKKQLAQSVLEWVSNA